MSQNLKFTHFHKLNMFRAPLCPSSGEQDYCCMWCSALVAVGDAVWSWDTSRVHYMKVAAAGTLAVFTIWRLLQLGHWPCSLYESCCSWDTGRVHCLKVAAAGTLAVFTIWSLLQQPSNSEHGQCPSWEQHLPLQQVQYTICSNNLVLLKMGIMVPEACWIHESEYTSAFVTTGWTFLHFTFLS
jgi:hypothetical protein